MKKTFNINIAGFPFVIDEDAYNLLNDYLKTIEHAFRHVDGASELINDLESRIAELLLQSAETGSAIITLADVEQIIARVGKPEEFVEEGTVMTEDEEGNTQAVNVETESVTPPPYIPNPPRIVKRLYRDPQSAMLGGVCSGVAWYINWDVTWVRLLFVILTLISYATWPIVYLVLWIVVPEARTPLQRMQMMGEQPTMENIGKTVTDNFKEAEGIKTPSQPMEQPRTMSFLNSSFNIFTKIIIICGLIIGIPILIAITLGLIGCVLFLISWGAALLFGTGMPFDDIEMMPYMRNIILWGVLCGIGWILTLGIPLMYLVRRGLNSSPLKNNIRRIINVIWGCGFILAGVSTGMVISYAYKAETYQQEQYKLQREQRNQLESSLENIDIESDMANLSIEEIDRYVDRINEQAEKFELKAEKLQLAAEKMMNRAESMKKKAESNKGDSKKFNRMAEKFNRKAESYKKQAEEWQIRAEKMLNKSEKLMGKATGATQIISDAATTPKGATPSKVSPKDSIPVENPGTK